MKTSNKRVRYAVVGLGHIAQVAVLTAFAHARNSELAALISGDPNKAKKLAKKYNVPAFHYDDLEEAVEDEKVEAVYIALPNTQHRHSPSEPRERACMFFAKSRWRRPRRTAGR